MKQQYTKRDILRLVEEEDVEFIRLQFTDVFGNFKNVAITASQLEKALDHNFMFDASSIQDFAGIEDADMYLYPDLDTFTIFPWRPQQGKVARFICDIYKSDRTPFEADPRYILKKELERAASMGYTFHVGPECEFFLFHLDDHGQGTTETHEKASYFDLGPLDLGENARRDMVLTLESMGYEVESSHHEVAPAQHEIDFKYDEGLRTADNIMTFKLAVKTIAKRHGLHATFMPKPKQGMNGSGMHTNMSLSRDGKNVFYDPNDEYGLSKEAYYFIGGLLKHTKGMAAITNPLVNSYKRLVPGYEAPLYLGWSATNKSPMIRIPKGRGEDTRIELRSPDSASNPYLVLAVCLAAGLDGIQHKIIPPKSLKKQVASFTQEEYKDANIESLPQNLGEALSGLKASEFIQKILGESLCNQYLSVKEKEWEDYERYVTSWEIEQYLYRI